MARMRVSRSTAVRPFVSTSEAPRRSRPGGDRREYSRIATARRKLSRRLCRSRHAMPERSVG
ncbi:unnamed protein product [Spirodela intermedia]|uniref:Uncharacterized protein n=1 Tax=Spirodela intermedia TaxID=51605 RepID=A0A811G8S8_SPIIN|nr:unnamed protein product [Spirodela intermedia]